MRAIWPRMPVVRRCCVFNNLQARLSVFRRCCTFALFSPLKVSCFRLIRAEVRHFVSIKKSGLRRSGVFMT